MGTATGVAMLAGAVILLDRVRAVCTALLSVGMMLSLSAVVGFAYSAKALFGIRLLDSMAIQTAVSLMALYAAAFVMRPEREPVRTLFARELGSEARIELLAATWFVPLLIGLAIKQGLVRGWYEAPFGMALFAVGLISLQTFLIWRSDSALVRLSQK